MDSESGKYVYPQPDEQICVLLNAFTQHELRGIQIYIDQICAERNQAALVLLVARALGGINQKYGITLINKH